MSKPVSIVADISGDRNLEQSVAYVEAHTGEN